MRHVVRLSPPPLRRGLEDGATPHGGPNEPLFGEADNGVEGAGEGLPCAPLSRGEISILVPSRRRLGVAGRHAPLRPPAVPRADVGRHAVPQSRPLDAATVVAARREGEESVHAVADADRSEVSRLVAVGGAPRLAGG